MFGLVGGAAFLAIRQGNWDLTSQANKADPERNTKTDTDTTTEVSQPTDAVPPTPTPRVVRKPSKPTPPYEPNNGLGDPYLGRALLIGVKNYLYANPVNPGFDPETVTPPTFGKTPFRVDDPLGLRSLRHTLIRDMNFDESQVAELSDVAERDPYPPTKSVIEDTINEFVVTSREEDSVLLMFMGHIVSHQGKSYLVPVDAELPPKAGEDDDQTKKDEIAAKIKNLVPLSWVLGKLKECPARHKLLVLDVACLDPEEGQLFNGSEPMPAAVEEELKSLPAGILAWTSCAPGQHSYQYASSRYFGSAFLHTFVDFGCVNTPAKRERLRNEGYQNFDWQIPFLGMSKIINRETTNTISSRGGTGLVQTPRMYGALTANKPAPEKGVPMPEPVAIMLPKNREKVFELESLRGILSELNLSNAGKGRTIKAESLPPFWAKDMVKYEADYVNLAEARRKPFRLAALEAGDILRRTDTNFKLGFRYPTGNNADAAFKRLVEDEQEKPALIYEQLESAKEKFDKMHEARDAETPRWKANFDFTYARFLGAMAFTQEYNFVLGNKLRKDNPMIENKENNGWRLVPQERMQQKETRSLVRDREKVLDRIIKENPKTVWELLARREKAATLGLTVVEALVRE
jgi:hypothetical protein